MTPYDRLAATFADAVEKAVHVGELTISDEVERHAERALAFGADHPADMRVPGDEGSA